MPPVNDSLSSIPAAPFASGVVGASVPAKGGEGGYRAGSDGEGGIASTGIPAPAVEPGYRRLPELNKDIDLARRALGSERWPIGPEMRAEVIGWLRLIVNNPGTDARTMVNAFRAILTADKLNLEELKILAQLDKSDREAEAAEQARQQAMQTLIAANSTEVNVNVKHSGEVTVAHTVLNRIAALESAFTGAADRTGEGALPSLDPRKPVGTGGD